MQNETNSVTYENAVHRRESQNSWTENWKDIPGYEGKYFISDQGRLRNRAGLIMKPMLCTNGYLTACLWQNNKQKKILIHRLVAEAFVPNISGFHEVNHKDENKINNVATNLEWCSHEYNMNYGGIKEKISAKNKGKKLSPEQRIRCATATNKKWMHDGIRELLVGKDEAPFFLSSGFNLGRLSKNV